MKFDPHDYFYHYTTFDSCIKIIRSNTLLFGRLTDMNDINELYRPQFYDFFDDKLERSIEYIEKFQQISLTDNGKRYGFDIPSMWGHYAEKGRGVCLVFKKIEFEQNLKKMNIVCGQIRYTKHFSSDILFEHGKDGKLKPFSKRKIKNFFFKKTKDWENEQEFRILHTNADALQRMKLDIGSSLYAVIMHNAPNIKNSESIFESSNFNELSKIFPKERIWEYGTFINNINLRDYNGNQVWPEPIDINNVENQWL